MISIQLCDFCIPSSIFLLRIKPLEPQLVIILLSTNLPLSVSSNGLFVSHHNAKDEISNTFNPRGIQAVIR